MPLTADAPPTAAPATRRGRARPIARPQPSPRPQSSVGGRFVLGGLNWQAYRGIRDDPGNARFKFTYDGPTGRLEVEMPQGPRHESVACVLAFFVIAFRQAGGPRFRATGTVTLDREDLDRGLECDKSFYIANLDYAPDLDANTLDLTHHPPPDLAVEVDVTSPGVSKLPIFAALGVPEVWVWDAENESLTARRLGDAGEFVIVSESVELPGFPLAVAAELIRDRGDRDDGELQAAFAERLRAAG